MPYEGEAASRLGHVPTASNPKVREALRRWTVVQGVLPPDAKVKALCASLDALPDQIGDCTLVRHSITVDGSDEEVEATRQFPTVKVGFIRIAASLVDLVKFRALGHDEFIDPREMRAARSDVAVDAALPGSGLQIAGINGLDTWRTELNAFLHWSGIDENSPLTLADGLMSINQASADADTLVIERCATCDYRTTGGSAGPIQVIRQAREHAESAHCSDSACAQRRHLQPALTCPSPTCGAPVLLSDVLRLHDEYNSEGSNFSPITRAMNVGERLMTTCFIDHLAATDAGSLGTVLFVTDGPLALFGPSAPQHREFLGHLQRQGDALRSANPPVPGPLLVGVEKSGPFFEHANAIRDLVPSGHVMMLTQSYINGVLGKNTDNHYGTDEFYGRRFLYRTTEGDMLVLTVVPRHGVAPYGKNPLSEKFESYPTLKVVCEVLDSLRTRMYDDAVIPIALAHSTASLPLGVGRSVLTKLVQQNVDGLHTNHQAIRKPSYYK